ATSLGLTYFSVPSKSGGVTQQLEVPAAPSSAAKPGETKPAAPAPSAPAPAGNPAESSKSSEIPKEPLDADQRTRAVTATSCRRGGIGRHAVLRGQCRKA